MPLPPSLHEILTRAIYRPVLDASRRSRSSQRAAYAAYRDGLEFRDGSHSWSDGQRVAWQLEQLRRTVRYAYDSTPFYKERLDEIGFDPHLDFGFEDYASIPILEREHVREAGERILSRAVPRELLREDSTGGSTGTPTRLWKGPVERGWAESGSEYFMRRIGLAPGGRIGYLWGHHLDTTVRTAWRDRLKDHITASRWYDCFRLDEAVLAAYHADMQRWRPQGIVAYANALGALAEAVLQMDGEGRPSYPRTAFVTGAEKLYSHHRDAVRRAFGRSVHERYGSRDVGLMGFQLDPDRSLDFTVDWAKLIIEPDSAPDDSGIAGILVTKLRADGMPMLRYRVGDVARFPAGARPGKPALLLHEVIGRDMDRLWMPGGRWMHPVGLPHLMKDFPVQDFQLHQQRDMSIVVRIVPDTAYSEDSGRSILDTLQMNLPGLIISLNMVDSIPRTSANKWRPVMSDVTPIDVDTR